MEETGNARIEDTRRSRVVWITLAGALFIVLVLAGPFVVGKWQEKARLDKVKAEVASGLRDPASAQFRDVTVGVKSGMACGEVNGKNAYGAYAGFQKFTYYPSKGVDLEPTFGPGISDNEQYLQNATAALWSAGYFSCRAEVSQELIK